MHLAHGEFKDKGALFTSGNQFFAPAGLQIDTHHLFTQGYFPVINWITITTKARIQGPREIHTAGLSCPLTSIKYSAAPPMARKSRPNNSVDCGAYLDVWSTPATFSRLRSPRPMWSIASSQIRIFMTGRDGVPV